MKRAQGGLAIPASGGKIKAKRGCRDATDDWTTVGGGGLATRAVLMQVCVPFEPADDDRPVLIKGFQRCESPGRLGQFLQMNTLPRSEATPTDSDAAPRALAGH